MKHVDEIQTLGEMKDILFMQQAIEQAELAALIGEVPIGAVVVCDGEVIAAAYNRREIDRDPSAHAEFRALVEAAQKLGRWRLTGCTVYVTLEPCLMCAGLMHQARIDRCVYGASDPKAGALGTLYSVHDDTRLNHRFEATSGICEEECSTLLSAFFENLRADKGRQAVAPECSERAERSGQAGLAEQAERSGLAGQAEQAERAAQ